MEMKKYKLYELCKQNEIGIYGIPATAEEFSEEKIRYLRITDISDDGILLDDDKKSVSDDYIEKYILQEGDIVFARTGNSTGRAYLYDKKDGILAFAGFLIKYGLDKNKVNPKFLRYYTIGNTYKQWVKNLSVGSTRGNISAKTFAECPISLPDRKQQDLTIDVLSSLDDKIALNRRMNAKLEQMAKHLYDHWFVQFDFPNADGKPYKANGGKMVWNETLKREIPEGWEVKSVNDISTSYRGVGYTADDEKSAEDNDVVLILRGNNISNNHIIYDGNTVYLDKSFVSEEQKIHKYDFVMTMSSGSKEHVGKSAMFLFDSPHSYGAFCNKITPAKDCQFLLENYLHSEYFKKYIQITCSGTGINNLTNEHFEKAFFAFPDNEVLESFNEKINPIYEQIGVFEKENLRLIALRDKLLPLLMNGQVEVR